MCVCVCVCMCMCRRGGNGFTQLPGVWHWNFALSPTHSQAPLLCLRLLSSPGLYPVHVQAVNQPGGTSLWSFISDGAVFQNPSLQRTLWLGPMPTPWGRVSLRSGWVPACPRKCSCHHAVAEVQKLQQITIHSWCQVSLHSGIFVPIPANVAAL